MTDQELPDVLKMEQLDQVQVWQAFQLFQEDVLRYGFFFQGYSSREVGLLFDCQISSVNSFTSLPVSMSKSLNSNSQDVCFSAFLCNVLVKKVFMSSAIFIKVVRTELDLKWPYFLFQVASCLFKL